jgi:bleomycin hydrolase
MAGGGAFHDVSDMIREYGIVPEEVYPGTLEGEAGHVHGEMDFVFKSYLDAVIANKNKKLSPVWHKGFNSLLDAYLGEYPDTFTYGGKQYTPASYAKSLGLKLDDYVQVTSYTHHPFYAPFALEVPDNWAWGTAYNVPLDELVEIIDYSIEKGYTVAWASDISEKGFSFKNGVAIVPEKDRTEMSDAEILKWEKLTEKDKEKDLYSFTKPGKEKVVTQEMRQEAFDNYLTTDDHGMHITGTAKDQNGTPYYLVKNSWADNSNSYKGYFYVSVPFVRYKTLDIMVHKDAIPAHIRKKLGI